jgi:hypothetical protein
MNAIRTNPKATILLHKRIDLSTYLFVRYLTTLSVARLYSIDLMDDRRMMIWRTSRCDLIEILYGHFPGGKPRKTSG